MQKKRKYNVTINLPTDSVFLGEVGDVTKDYCLYEFEEESILERIYFNDIKDVKFLVKKGQFVEKGTPIFSQGILGYKLYITNFSGIVDIGKNYYQLIGNNLSYKRKINLDGKIKKVKLPEYVIIELNSYKIELAFWLNKNIEILKKIVIKKMADLLDGNKISYLKFLDSLCFINENISLLELQKLIEFGVKKLIVNAIYVDDWILFVNLLKELDSFGVITGFGQYVFKKFNLVKDNKYDVVWVENQVYLCDEIEFINDNLVFEHPFWGINGKIKHDNHLKVILEKNQEFFEIYKKNIFKINTKYDEI